MNQNKLLATLYSAIVILIVVSFFYQGVITKLPVSIDYNVPIAQSIISGQFLNLQSNNPYMYFPGSSHVILALFLFFKLPVNLFGLLSWVVLFFVCKKLGETFGLSRYLSIIFAASFCTTMSVIRTVGDQSIDKWLCTWFVLSLILLEKMSNNWKASLAVGFSLGMLVGSKYSGPLFFIPLVLFYGVQFVRKHSVARIIGAGIVFTIVGLFWYIRNFFLTGSPLFPANLPFLKGYPNYTQQDWMLWKVPIDYPPGVVDLLNAFLSEYLIWAFAIPFVVGFFIYSYRKHLSIDKRVQRLFLLGIATGIASLFLPITPAYKIELFHIISDMRYIYIVVVIFMLIIFLFAEKYKKDQLLGSVALINSIPVFSFIPYLPKIYIIAFILFTLISKTRLNKLIKI